MYKFIHVLLIINAFLLANQILITLLSLSSKYNNIYKQYIFISKIEQLFYFIEHLF